MKILDNTSSKIGITRTMIIVYHSPKGIRPNAKHPKITRGALLHNLMINPFLSRPETQRPGKLSGLVFAVKKKIATEQDSVWTLSLQLQREQSKSSAVLKKVL